MESKVKTAQTDVLVLGAGPAGLTAAGEGTVAAMEALRYLSD